MRVLLSTYGSRGDVEPMVALALRLRELDAEVHVAAPPDDDFSHRLAEVGVPFTGIGVSAKALMRAKPAPRSLPERAAELVGSITDVLPEVAASCDVVVATGALPAAAAARSVAEKVGIPSVSVTFQQLTLPSPDRAPIAYAGKPLPPGATVAELWEFDARSIDELFGEALNVNRERLGLKPVDSVRDYVFGERPWLATDPVLDPTGLPVVQTGAWVLADERPLAADLLEFLDAGTPPVYAGFGSMPLHQAQDAAQVALDAARAHGRRVVISRGWADLDATDDDCFVLGEANHQQLFRRVAAVVHHGGAGTTTTAAFAGAPQVVVPQGVDQPYWANRVAALGIGAAHDGATPTSASLTGALEVALAARTRERATSVAAAMRTDGTTAAAELLISGGGR